MRVVASTPNTLTLAAGRREVALLIAAARMALDAVTRDPGAPPEAGSRLAAVLRELDAALATASNPNRREGDPCTSPS